MNKGLSLLGLAKKAGRLALGNESVTSVMRWNQAKLLIASRDAGENTIRRLNSRRGNTPLLQLPQTKEELGSAVGYKSLAVLAICDEGLAEAFLNSQEDPQRAAPASNTYNQPKDGSI